VSGKKTAEKSSNPKKKAADKSGNGKTQPADMWIAVKPSSAAASARKWSEQPSSPAGSRILELADIALGLKKPENFRKRRSGVLKQKP
jgi:hypothetical protein